MTVLNLVVTDRGYAALVNAANTGTDAIEITEVGLTAADFVAASSLTALPGEFRRLSTIAGEATGPNTLNLVMRDDDPVTYTVRGFALYLQSGELFAAFSSNSIILEKSDLASMLVTIDVAFTDVDTALIEFGDMSWTNPQATTERKGVVELATALEAIAGEDPERAVTPVALAAALQALISGTVQPRLDLKADKARLVSGGGLVTGGGDLSANRILTVTEATEAESIAGTISDKVVTPRRLKAAINALIAGAPGALDTLDELAAALGDDANFAATMTNQLALKASIAYVDAQLAAARNLLQSERRGDVVFRATQTVPAGAYECDGRELSRTGADAQLFAVIGTSYGAGNGTTTFNIPDMRGQFPRGWDHGAGVDSGRVWGSKQLDELKSHSHSIPANSDQNSGNGHVEDASGEDTARTTFTGATGGIETRPKNVAGMFVIWR